VPSAELEGVLGGLKASLQFDKWVEDPERVLSTDVWVEKRVALAVPSFMAWEPVEAAFGLIESIRRLEMSRGVKAGDPIVPPKFREDIQRDTEFIEIARDASRDFGKVPEFKHKRFRELARGSEDRARERGWKPHT
jgi:hypothetical protein